MHDRIGALLHDAEHLDVGASFAGLMGDTPAEVGLREKRNRLLDEALALDPQRTTPASQETTLAQGRSMPHDRPRPR